MTSYYATCLINCKEFPRFTAYTDGDPLAYDYALVLHIDADTTEAAAAKAFEIGNRMAWDVDGKEWPSWCRSLSVGDVVCVDGQDDYAVAPFGWTKLEGFNHAGPWNAPGGRAKMAKAGSAADGPDTDPRGEVA